MTAQTPEEIKVRIKDALGELNEFHKRVKMRFLNATPAQKEHLRAVKRLLDEINPIWTAARDAYNNEQDDDAIANLTIVNVRLEYAEMLFSRSPKPVNRTEEVTRKATGRFIGPNDTEVPPAAKPLATIIQRAHKRAERRQSDRPFIQIIRNRD